MFLEQKTDTRPIYQQHFCKSFYNLIKDYFKKITLILNEINNERTCISYDKNEKSLCLICQCKDLGLKSKDRNFATSGIYLKPSSFSCERSSQKCHFRTSLFIASLLCLENDSFYVSSVSEYLRLVYIAYANQLLIRMSEVICEVNLYLENIEVKTSKSPLNERVSILITDTKKEIYILNDNCEQLMQKRARLEKCFGRFQVIFKQNISTLFSSLQQLEVLGCGPIPFEVTEYQRNDLFFFRGVTSPEFTEIPKVFRKETIGYCEDETYEMYLNEFPDMRNGNSLIDILTNMQHYELPTRLLDVSTNPLVALYMACTNDYSTTSEMGKYGEILIYFPKFDKKHGSQVKFATNGLVEFLAALPTLDKYEKNSLKEGINIWTRYKQSRKINSYIMFGRNVNSIKKLVTPDEISILEKTNGAFKKLFRAVKRTDPAASEDFLTNVGDLLRTVVVLPEKVNERIRAQQGAFILFGLSNNIDIDSSRTKKTRIIICNKQNILAELDLLGFSRKTLTPDKVNVAKDMSR